MKTINNWLDWALKKIGLARASVTCYYAGAAAHNLLALEARIEDLHDANEMIKSLRAQLVTVRVAQAERPRMGWEVMCYIPEEVVGRMSVKLRDYAEAIAGQLVFQALTGIINVNNKGRCNALVFSPLNINGPAEASKWVVGIFEKDGKFSVSEKAHVKLEKLEDTNKLYREYKPYSPITHSKCCGNCNGTEDCACGCGCRCCH